MRVAVTGANGLLGAEAVAQLAGRHEVLAIGRGPCRLDGALGSSSVRPEAIPFALSPSTPPPVAATLRAGSARPAGAAKPKDEPSPFALSVAARSAAESKGEAIPFTYVDADLGDGQSVEAALRAFRAEAVLHAGAATDVDGCERDPELAWRVNVGGTEQVARACRALGARLVAVSTDYVFDGTAGPYSEEDVPNPRGAYARTKRCGEEAALLLAPDCAVARVAVVYSGRRGAKNTFATQVVEKLSRGEVVKAFSDQLVTTTLASNGASMCLELLLETRYRGVLHTSDATVLDRVDFAQRIARRFGLSGEIVPVKTADVKLPAPRPLQGGLKVERAAGLLRSKPLSIDEALERFFAEWQTRRGAGRAP